MVWGPVVVAVAKMVGKTAGLEALKIAGREVGKLIGKGNSLAPERSSSAAIEREVAHLRKQVQDAELAMAGLAEQIAATSEHLQRLLARVVLLASGALFVAVVAVVVALVF